MSTPTDAGAGTGDTPNPKPAGDAGAGESQGQQLPEGFTITEGTLHYKGKPFDPIQAMDTIKAQREEKRQVKQEATAAQQRAEAAGARLLELNAGSASQAAQLQTTLSDLQSKHAQASAELATAKATIADQAARLESLTTVATGWLDEQTKDWPEAVKKTYVGKEDDIPARLAWAKAVSSMMAEEAAEEDQAPPAGGNRTGPRTPKERERTGQTGNGNRRTIRRF